jgi:hypothetical protein
MPLSMMSPTVEVAVSVPATVEAAKFKLVDVIAAFPTLVRATGPVRAFVEVDRSMFPADVKLLAAASVSTPLWLIPPTVEVAVRGPPTLEVPRFKVCELTPAAPVPVVVSRTGPVKLLTCVARFMP